MSEFQKVGNQKLLRENWDAIFGSKTNAKPKPVKPDPNDDLDPNEVLRKYYEDAGVPLD